MGLLDSLDRFKDRIIESIFDTKPSVPQQSKPETKVISPPSTPSFPNEPIVTKPEKLTIKDHAERINELIQVDNQQLDYKIVFYCPIRKAKIYCHSILVDKLGDLTKFIITSLYKGHSIDEICELTQMGSTTIKEEFEYLIRGKLVLEDNNILTELGNQYGKLLELFKSFSDGIDVFYNVFTEKFEPIKYDIVIEETNLKYGLNGHVIPILARNDNFSNSLEIAKMQIAADTPFCDEIKDSLYASVIIEREEKYKAVYLRNLDLGCFSPCNKSIGIAIPYDRVLYRPRYRTVDQYRPMKDSLNTLYHNYNDLLSEKAKDLIGLIDEEENTPKYKKIINAFSGTIESSAGDLVDSPNNTSLYVLERNNYELILKDDSCSDIYLEEEQREKLYIVRYYPYSVLED